MPSRKNERRESWLDMLWGLRFSKPKITPGISDGDCQRMFDYLLQREWPGPGNAPKCRWDTHRAVIKYALLRDLIAAMPEWARSTHRKPHSFDGCPIFYRHGNGLIYLDGRRRISAYAAQGVQRIDVWVVGP